MVQLNQCFKWFFFCHLLLLQASMVFPEINSRIVGGTTTTIDEVPYLVQLLINGRFFCGGTLVATRYVVTAAHCMNGMRAEYLTVVAGATMLTDAGVRSKVSKIMVPKGYNVTNFDKDVAVLKLHTPIEGPGIQPTVLCTKNWKPGSTVKVSGWGYINEYNETNPIQVRTVNVNVITKSKCAKLYRELTTLTNSMFCAAIPGLKDSCGGDSGGAAFINDQFCGIVSFGSGCARKEHPGVYTSVLAVSKFIEDAMMT